VHVVPNGIDVARFRFAPRTPGPVTRVAYAGQLTPAKGVHTLLAAVRHLRDRGGPAVELTVAGDGPARPALEAYCRAHRLGGVRFAGHVDAVAGLFARADVAVVPSEWAEAFGLAAAEAMATGAAVLVSDAGALPEVVGPAGVVFRAGDPADLADRLAALAADPELRARLGRAARDRVERHFTLDGRVTALVGLCRRVLGGGRGPVAAAAGCPR
jgi:glycosyltransferase involved in cell wall biosynthesis